MIFIPPSMPMLAMPSFFSGGSAGENSGDASRRTATEPVKITLSARKSSPPAKRTTTSGPPHSIRATTAPKRILSLTVFKSGSSRVM